MALDSVLDSAGEHGGWRRRRRRRRRRKQGAEVQTELEWPRIRHSHGFL
jgi:hypothetical protein